MSNDCSRGVKFGLWYDFRNPQQWRRPYDTLYSEILEQIVWAEDRGFEYVWLSEHHFSDDGYSPSMFPIAAAIGARTKKIRIGTSLVLLPLHHPVRIAEDGATVDVISGGRFELGAGIGYRVEEFAAFDIPVSERGGRTSESLEIIRRLWEGETLSFKGRYYNIEGARVTPEPIQKPRPPLWAGGFTAPGIKRAARLADGYAGIAPNSTQPSYELFMSEWQRLGKAVEEKRTAGGLFWLIPSRDPDKTWTEAAEHVIHQVNAYREWTEKAGETMFPKLESHADLRETGMLQVVEVDECIEIIRDYVNEMGLTHYYSWTLPPGLPASWAQPYLELFAEQVIPAFR